MLPVAPTRLHVVGNASSMPPRLPDLSYVLRSLRDRNPKSKYAFTMVCLSYRGYWRSRGRPTEKGINKDTEAAAQWIADECSKSGGKHQPILIVWGQSIGAGFATNLAVSPNFPKGLRLNAMILETPFLSIKAMLSTLYPERWVPYKHLWPFLRNHLDNWKNLGLLAEQSKAAGIAPPRVFILAAGRDELVPAEQSDMLYQRCVEVGVPVEKTSVPKAYHNESMIRAEGRRAVAVAIEKEVADALKADGKSGSSQVR